MYDLGEGVKQDYAEAIKWYRLVAGQDNADAQNGLGTMYINGDGVPQDYAEALKWFQVAAEQGNEEALTNLNYTQQANLNPNTTIRHHQFEIINHDLRRLHVVTFFC